MTGITGILLAGGQSRRMGTAKAFIQWRGRSLFEHPLSALQEVCAEVLIVTKTPELYENCSARVCRDDFPDAGPLGGIYTGLRTSQNSRVIVLACDMPYVRRNILDALADASGWNPMLDAIVPLAPNTNSGNEIQPQPLCALYSRKCMTEFRAQILQGSFSLKQSLTRLKVKFSDWRELDPSDTAGISFTNVNSPEDVKKAIAFSSLSSSLPPFSKAQSLQTA